MALTPQQRSTKALRDLGYYVEVVEKTHRLPHRTWKTDLFGFADLLAIRKGEVLAVQVTSSSHLADRIRKIEDSDLVGAVREAGIRIEAHGWRLSRNGRWVCKIVDVS